MSWDIAVSAPAKVNLHLEIRSRRADGYHGILSLFQAVTVFDEIRIRGSMREGDLSISGDHCLLPSENTIARAVEVFREETGIREGLDIGLEKNIPLGGGLGGGSSDAAAVLLGLQGLFDSPISHERLLALAAGIGSDVPFFLQGPASVIEGRGELVRGITARDDYALVALFPASAVSTSEAYRWLDEDRSALQSRRSSPEKLAENYMLPVREWEMWNDFDSVVFRRIPGMEEERDALAAAGALQPRLTGSGGTIFGILPDEPAALSCAGRLATRRTAVLRPLAKMPGVR
jgi:4-diphosphocytidyl-2-C-methyl-D-erythritol kinase